MTMEPFNNKKSETIGLWYRAGSKCFVSGAINLKKLKAYKGSVVICVKKNKFYQQDTNRPNYVAWINDIGTAEGKELQIEEIDDNDDLVPVYTEEQVRAIIAGAYHDCAYGFTDPGDTLASDFAEPLLVPRQALMQEEDDDDIR